MPCTFNFYTSVSEVGLTESTYRAGQLIAIASSAKLELQGYAQPSYEAMVISSRRNSIAQPAALNFRTQIIRRGYGGRPMADAPSILLVTLCLMRAADQSQFLNQFDRALSFIKGKPGFFTSRLFRECDAIDLIRFVNIAHWSDLNSFQCVFRNPAFHNIVSTTFRPTSELMLAEIPSTSKHKLQ